METCPRSPWLSSAPRASMQTPNTCDTSTMEARPEASTWLRRGAGPPPGVPRCSACCCCCGGGGCWRACRPCSCLGGVGAEDDGASVVPPNIASNSCMGARRCPSALIHTCMRVAADMRFGAHDCARKDIKCARTQPGRRECIHAVRACGPHASDMAPFVSASTPGSTAPSWPHRYRPASCHCHCRPRLPGRSQRPKPAGGGTGQTLPELLLASGRHAGMPAAPAAAGTLPPACLCGDCRRAHELPRARVGGLGCLQAHSCV